MIRAGCRVILWAALLFAATWLPVFAQFNQYRQQSGLFQSGAGVWFYLQCTPGSQLRDDGMPMASGLNRSLKLDYGRFSSTQGLLQLPILGILYNPTEIPATFTVINKSTVPVTIVTSVVHSSGPGTKLLGDLLYVIPDSQYTGVSHRAASYSFSLAPGEQESMDSVIATGSVIQNVLGALLFSPYPVGNYSGFVRLQAQFEGFTESINIPVNLTVY